MGGGRASLLGLMLVPMVAAVLVVPMSRTDKKLSEARPPGISLNAPGDHVRECLQKVGEEAIYAVSLQGGYYVPPSDAVTQGDVKIPFYWKRGQSFMPSRSEIEEQLSFYVGDHMSSCMSSKRLLETGYSMIRPDCLISGEPGTGPTFKHYLKQRLLGQFRCACSRGVRLLVNTGKRRCLQADFQSRIQASKHAHLPRPQQRLGADQLKCDL